MNTKFNMSDKHVIPIISFSHGSRMFQHFSPSGPLKLSAAVVAISLF